MSNGFEVEYDDDRLDQNEVMASAVSVVQAIGARFGDSSDWNQRDLDEHERRAYHAALDLLATIFVDSTPVPEKEGDK